MMGYIALMKDQQNKKIRTNFGPLRNALQIRLAIKCQAPVQLRHRPFHPALRNLSADRSITTFQGSLPDLELMGGLPGLISLEELSKANKTSLV